ncbi:uncharacterized protein yc1106_00552 [Curvularia clavata]|uniref:Uncharacterized protein n=1 Tax=Curvularia clavata TaxID=95742 RepID=A0A9Q8Z3H7_CURCL|nr:uncharacterized protein yc1106_00552 [Curvularia clavata]
MMELSKQYSGSPQLMVGTPPDDQQTRLLRKVQSELNLATMRKARKRPSVSGSAASVFSGGSGDTLADEAFVSRQSIMQPATECNAFVALRELGTLVARQSGLQPESFNKGLMMLVSQSRPVELPLACQEAKDANRTIRQDTDSGRPSLERTRAHKRTVRKFQSQPQLSTHQKHHRRFSFEPGADELQALTKEMSYDGVSSSPTRSLSADLGKRSKIPSPVHNLGRSRKEVSTASLHSICGRYQDSRRGSGSSVITAFRESSSGSM